MSQMVQLPDRGYARLGPYLRRFREQSGYSRAEVSRITQIGARTIEEYESGKSYVSTPTGMRRYATWLGWSDESIAEVLDGGDPTLDVRPTPTGEEQMSFGPMTADEKQMLLLAVRTSHVFSDEMKARLLGAVERQPAVDDGASDAVS